MATDTSVTCLDQSLSVVRRSAGADWVWQAAYCREALHRGAIAERFKGPIRNEADFRSAAFCPANGGFGPALAGQGLQNYPTGLEFQDILPLSRSNPD